MPFTHLSLENYRIFKSKTDFEFAPITILTGANNSGKSSIIKAIQLLIESASQRDFLNLLLWKTETKFANYDSLINNQNAGINDEVSFYLKCSNDSWPEFDTAKLTYRKNKNFGEIKQLVLYKNGEENSPLLNVDLSIHEEKLELSLEWLYTKCFSQIKKESLKKVKPDLLKFIKSNLPVLDQQLKKEIKNAIKNLKFLSGQSWNNFITGIEYYTFESNNDEDGNSLPDYFESYDDKILDLYNEDDRTIIKTAYNNFYIKLRDEYFIKCKELINDLKNNFLSTVMYIPTNRQEPVREFSYNDTNTLSKKLFKIIDENIISNVKKEKSLIYSQPSGVHFGPEDFRKFRFTNDMLSKIFNLNGKLVCERNETNQNIQILIMFHKDGDRKINIADLGSGTYQLLILLLSIEIAIHESKKSLDKTILVEEPEINLHPNFQSKLADVFAEAYKEYGVKFIVETHSEHLIRKLQLLTAQKENPLSSEDSVIYYLFSPNNIPEGESQIRKINITKDGRLTKDFGSGFFDESTKIIFDLWKIQGLN